MVGKELPPRRSQNYINPLLLSFLKAEVTSRILDLGCGNGALCQCITFHGFDVVGVESDEQGVSIAREQSPSVNFYQIDVDGDGALIRKLKVCLMLLFQLKSFNIFILFIYRRVLRGVA